MPGEFGRIGQHAHAIFVHVQPGGEARIVGTVEVHGLAGYYGAHAHHGERVGALRCVEGAAVVEGPRRDRDLLAV